MKGATVFIYIWFLRLYGVISGGCNSPQYIALGAKGTVHCHFQTEFVAVFWYSSTDTVSEEPIVTYYPSSRQGKNDREYTSGEFDVQSDGSLVIHEVAMVHEHNYTVAKFTSLEEYPTKFEVQVIVTAPDVLPTTVIEPSTKPVDEQAGTVVVLFLLVIFLVADKICQRKKSKDQQNIKQNQNSNGNVIRHHQDETRIEVGDVTESNEMNTMLPTSTT